MFGAGCIIDMVACEARARTAGDAKRESARLAIAGWGNCNDCHKGGVIGRMRTDDPSQFGSVTRVIAFSRERCRFFFFFIMATDASGDCVTPTLEPNVLTPSNFKALLKESLKEILREPLPPTTSRGDTAG